MIERGRIMHAYMMFAFASIFLFLVLFRSPFVTPTGATKTWIVDDDGKSDFPKIQEAINAANPGDIIQVFSGTYYEHLIVNKTVTLIGENSSTTTINGNGTGTVVHVPANFVNISRFTIQQSGDDGQGVLIDQSSNSIIEGNIIMSNYQGLSLEKCEKTTIKENLVDNNFWGICLYDSENNMIKGNLITNNYRHGLHFDSSNNNTVNQNVVADNFEGIYLKSSSGNMLRNNNLTENMYGLGVSGSELPHFIHDIDTSNVLDKKPIHYWVNQHDKRVPTDAGYVAVVNSTRITIKDLNLTRDYQEGLLLAYTTNSTIENVYSSNGNWGIRLISCKGLKVTGNTFASNWKGLRMDYSEGNIISRNVLMDNHEGIFLYHSNGNVIKENVVTTNIRGVWVYYSTNNAIYHNNFINNEKQVFIAPARILVLNSWDNGYEGNYWSNYTGTDDNEDGIGEPPHILNEINHDNYPLMGSFTNFPTVVEEETHHITTICNSTISSFKLNFTDKIISFNVTGPNHTVGFCRISIPHKLLNGPYVVLVDGSLPDTLKELASSNSTHTIVYFTYVHSTHQVIIVPESPSPLVLIFVMTALTIASTLLRINHRRK